MPCALRLPRSWLTMLLCVPLAGFLVPNLSAQGTGTCGAKDYKIMSLSSIAVRCASDVSGVAVKDVSGYAMERYSHYAARRKGNAVALHDHEGVAPADLGRS